MNRRSCVVLTFLWLASPARADPAPNPVLASGYHESSEDRPLVAAAINKANSVLRASGQRELVPSWIAPATHDAAAAIQVYLVAPSQDNFTIECPFRSCGCIFLQTKAFKEGLNRYSTKLPSMIEIDPEDMLGFMFLHEVGHIVHNDLGSFDKEGPDYNFDETSQKVKETAADRFAAEMIKSAGDQTHNTEAFLASFRMQLALTNASWNLSALRLLDGFGGTALCSKFLFADKGGSHPNFELRILAVNDLLTNTQASRELLASFEKCRKPSSGVIFRKEN